jgi:Na+-driven multidrug efflux pump
MPTDDTVRTYSSRACAAGNRARRWTGHQYLQALLAVVGVLSADPIVRWLGAGAQAAPYAATYLRVSSLGLPGMLLVLAATGLLRGLHDMRTPLVVAAAMAVAYAYIVVSACRAEGITPWPDARAIRASLSANFALLVRTIGLRVYWLAAVWAAGRLGTDALAANTIAANLWITLALALDALAIAAQALVGHELGAGRIGQTRRVVAQMNWWGLWFGVVTGVGLAALSPVLAGAFTSDQAVARVLMPVAIVAAVSGSGRQWLVRHRSQPPWPSSLPGSDRS